MAAIYGGSSMRPQQPAAATASPDFGEDQAQERSGQSTTRGAEKFGEGQGKASDRKRQFLREKV